MKISKMVVDNYDEAYDLWSRTAGMGLRSIDDSREGIAKFLNRNPNTNFICRDQNRLIGIILCGNDGRRAYIYHMVVLDQYRGKGVGSAMLNHLIESLKKEGVTKSGLLVYEDNEIGNQFWESQGFGRRDDIVYRDRSLNDENI